VKILGQGVFTTEDFRVGSKHSTYRAAGLDFLREESEETDVVTLRLELGLS
jgi:hypothetical protein